MLRINAQTLCPENGIVRRLRWDISGAAVNAVPHQALARAAESASRLYWTLYERPADAL
jgi:hypothetical protein